MTLNEIERLASLTRGPLTSADVQTANALILILPVVRAAITAADAQVLTDYHARTKYENDVWCAVDALRIALMSA
jgi:hypothetical protein